MEYCLTISISKLISPTEEPVTESKQIILSILRKQVEHQNLKIIETWTSLSFPSFHME